MEDQPYFFVETFGEIATTLAAVQREQEEEYVESTRPESGPVGRVEHG